MAIITVPLADRSHSAINQIRLTAPELLLEDGRIIHFLSRLTTCCTGARCAWELVFTSAADPSGAALEARLITHASVAAAQRAALPGLSAGLQAQLLQALQENDIAAQAATDALPPLTDKAFIPLYRQGSGLICEDAELTPGHLRQHLCTRPGNGLSLLLVLSQWQEGELDSCTAGLSDAQQAMLGREPVFDFVVTLWGPDARENAAWLQHLTLSRLTPATLEPRAAMSYAPCLRRDPWRLMTLLPAAAPRPTLLSLPELLTVCGCPAEPGEMQRMCRMTWRERAADALREADVALLPMDMPLTQEDLRYMGLESDSDLENVLHMDAQMSDMLRMCVAILRKLNAMGDAAGSDEAVNHRLGLLLPTVGHIYEQFVRECCYQTMYCPYITYATGRQPAQVVKVFLSTYDLGPGHRGYRLRKMPEGASEPAMQSIIRERMIDDFRDHARIGGRSADDGWWYSLFNDMTTARSQRNGLTHERANVLSARSFARAFLQDLPKHPSLLRRLLMCRQITTNFPAL
ncbi:MAG: hypothetical protein IJE07_06890 [Clostridia bacterium]|nr:hypothetical protein [Clostridia bacterium]